jgi:two-component system chemotaxis sensor kinase CheA
MAPVALPPTPPRGAETRSQRRAARLGSLEVKVSALVVGLSVLIIALFAVSSLDARIKRAKRAVEAKATSLALLSTRELEPAVAFDDAETARDVFESIARDQDVVGVALYGDDGRLIAAAGKAPPFSKLGRQSAIHIAGWKKHVTAFAAVESPEGPRGTLEIDVSTQRVDEERREIYFQTLKVGGAATLFAVVAAWLIGRGIARRLARITRLADAVAIGELDHAPLRDVSHDEVGRLARAFDVMLESIHALMNLQKAAAEEERARLDRLVVERTAELAKRNAALRNIFDHVPVGILTVDRDGRVGDECSLTAAGVFGVPQGGPLLWDYLASDETDFSSALAASWEQITDGFLPFEVAVDQLPKEVRQGRLVFALEVLPMGIEARDTYLVALKDVSAERERRAGEELNRELAVGLKRFVSDPAGFGSFLHEARVATDLICQETEVTPAVSHALHTLKGNALVIGFDTIGERCHALETYVSELGELPPREARAELQSRIDRLSSIFSVGSFGARGRLNVPKSDLVDIVRMLGAGAVRDAERSLQRLMLEPVDVPFERLAENARAVARRTGLGTVDIHIDSSSVRLDGERFAPFWSAAIHVVRNALVHGIEPHDIRERAGKPTHGRLTLGARQTATFVEISVSDDGAGIDWSAIEQRAAAFSAIPSSQSELEEALFRDGVSTARAVDEIAGRGVGLGAVRSTVKALGGETKVSSTRGLGTTFRFRFPRVDRPEVFDANPNGLMASSRSRSCPS